MAKRNSVERKHMLAKRREEQLSRKPRYQHKETAKNESYIAKRKQLGQESTALLGVTCFG